MLGSWAWVLGSGRTPQLTAVVEEGGEAPQAAIEGDGDLAPAIDPGLQVIFLAVSNFLCGCCNSLSLHIEFNL